MASPRGATAPKKIWVGGALGFWYQFISFCFWIETLRVEFRFEWSQAGAELDNLYKSKYDLVQNYLYGPIELDDIVAVLTVGVYLSYFLVLDI